MFAASSAMPDTGCVAMQEPSLAHLVHRNSSMAPGPRLVARRRLDDATLTCVRVSHTLDPLTILYGSTARSGEILAKTAVAPSEATVVEGESAMRGQA